MTGASTVPWWLDRAALLGALALIASVPIEDASAFGPLSLSRVVGAGTFAVTTLHVLASGRVRCDVTTAVVLCAYASWAAASYFWSDYQVATLTYLATLVQLLGMVVVIWQSITTRERFRMAFGALATGGLAGAVLSLTRTVSAHSGVPRYSVGDPNDFGIGLTLTLVAAIYLTLTARRTWVRVVFALTTGLVAVAITRTASRTALVAVALAVLILLSHSRRIKLTTLALVAVVAAVGVYGIVRFTTVTSLQRLTGTLSAVESGDLNDRTRFWRLAVDYWTAHPLTGIGGGAFKTRSALDGGGKLAHSVLFGTLAQLGLVGLVLLVAVALVCARRISRMPDRTQAVHLVALAAVWACGAATLSLEVRKMTWLVVALATCQGATLLRRELVLLRGPTRAPVIPPQRRREPAGQPVRG